MYETGERLGWKVWDTVMTKLPFDKIDFYAIHFFILSTWDVTGIPFLIFLQSGR